MLNKVCFITNMHHQVQQTESFWFVHFEYESKYGCKDQESIQTSTTPGPGYQWESDKLTVRRHKRKPRCQPFHSRWPHKARINGRLKRHKGIPIPYNIILSPTTKHVLDQFVSIIIAVMATFNFDFWVVLHAKTVKTYFKMKMTLYVFRWISWI